jgi:hypothetical protein
MGCLLHAAQDWHSHKGINLAEHKRREWTGTVDNERNMPKELHDAWIDTQDWMFRFNSLLCDYTEKYAMVIAELDTHVIPKVGMGTVSSSNAISVAIGSTMPNASAMHPISFSGHSLNGRISTVPSAATRSGMEGLIGGTGCC